MRSYSDVVTSRRSTTTECTVTRVTIAVRASGAERFVQLHYDLRIAGAGETRQLLFDYLNCPLSIVAVTCDDGMLVDLGRETGQRLFAISPLHRWSAELIRMTIELAWPAGEHGRSHPFAIFPNYLPKPAQRTARPGQYLDVELFATPSSDGAEILGIQRSRAPWNPYENAQAQIVVLSREIVTGESVFGPVAHHPTGAAAPVDIDAIGRELRAQREFVAGIHGSDISVRPAILMTTPAEPLSRPAGALVVQNESFFAETTGGPSTLRTEGVEYIAGMWWGAGIQSPGHFGAALTFGISQWLTMRYLEANDLGIELRRLADRWIEYANVNLSDRESVQSHGRQFAARLALCLRNADLDGDRAVPVIRTMAQQHWGRCVEGDVLLKDLVDAGLRPPAWPAKRMLE